MSRKHADLLVKNLVRPYGRNSSKGQYVTRDNRTFSYKSGWELAVMQWLDTNTDVVAWDYECVRISYHYNDNKRWYVPDFLVTFIAGHREMWEIKPKFHRNAEQVRLKAEAAKAWCAQNDVSSYRILTGDLLRDQDIIK